MLRKKKVLFYKMLKERWRKKVYKNAPGSLQFSYNNLTRATTLLWNGTGLDLMFVYSSISCLATTTGDRGSLEGGPSLIKVHVGHRPGEGTKGLLASTRYYEPLIESAHSRSGKSAPVGPRYPTSRF